MPSTRKKRKATKAPSTKSDLTTQPKLSAAELLILAPDDSPLRKDLEIRALREVAEEAARQRQGVLKLWSRFGTGLDDCEEEPDVWLLFWLQPVLSSLRTIFEAVIACHAANADVLRLAEHHTPTPELETTVEREWTAANMAFADIIDPIAQELTDTAELLVMAHADLIAACSSACPEGLPVFLLTIRDTLESLEADSVLDPDLVNRANLVHRALELYQPTKTTPADADSADAVTPTRPLNETCRKALDYIVEHPRFPGKRIATHCDVSHDHFRKDMVPALNAAGVRNDGDGYYLPTPADTT